MCPCLFECQRQEVSLNSADLSVALLYVPASMQSELLLLSISVSLNVDLFWQNNREQSCLWGAELCYYMYLLTLDPPPNYSCMNKRTQTCLGETPLFGLLCFFFTFSVCFSFLCLEYSQCESESRPLFMFFFFFCL